MLPGSEKRKTRNSAKVNLFLSLTFHSLIVVGIFYFAAREGILGNNMKTFAVSLVEPEKKPEPKPVVASFCFSGVLVPAWLSRSVICFQCFFEPD